MQQHTSKVSTIFSEILYCKHHHLHASSSCYLLHIHPYKYILKGVQQIVLALQLCCIKAFSVPLFRVRGPLLLKKKQKLDKIFLVSLLIMSGRRSINSAHAFSWDLPSKNVNQFFFCKFIRSGKLDKGLSFRAMWRAITINLQ